MNKEYYYVEKTASGLRGMLNACGVRVAILALECTVQFTHEVYTF